MSTPDFELPPVELPFPLPSLDATPHGDPIAEAARDGGVLIPPAAGADASWEFSPTRPWKDAFDALENTLKEGVDLALNVIPVAGQVKGLIEGFVGEDLITGRHLAWWERVLNVASVGSLLKSAKDVEEASHLAEAIHEIGHTTHVVNVVVHVAHGGHEVGKGLGETIDSVGEALGKEGTHSEQGGDSERREDGPLEYPEHRKQGGAASGH
jgi:hypothetical protein